MNGTGAPVPGLVPAKLRIIFAGHYRYWYCLVQGRVSESMVDTNSLGPIWAVCGIMYRKDCRTGKRTLYESTTWKNESDRLEHWECECLTWTSKPLNGIAVPRSKWRPTFLRSILVGRRRSDKYIYRPISKEWTPSLKQRWRNARFIKYMPAFLSINDCVRMDIFPFHQDLWGIIHRHDEDNGGLTRTRGDGEPCALICRVFSLWCLSPV